MRLVTAAFLLAGFSAQAHAVNIDRVMSCLDLTPADFAVKATIRMSVELAFDGIVEAINVERYSPDDEQGRRIAQASAQAVVDCSPYEGESGTRTIVLWPNGRDSADPRITMPATGAGN